MIDIGKLRYNGELNYQNGLLFYFSNQGHVVSFLIETVGDRKRKIRITMHPDINHGRPHVHIDKHDASFAIDTGELLAGHCDNSIRREIEKWINMHREDLLELWGIIKKGRDYQPIVDRIKYNKSFMDYGFDGLEPENKLVFENVVVWCHDVPSVVQNDDGITIVVSAGDIFVGLPKDYQEGKIEFISSNGTVKKKKAL